MTARVVVEFQGLALFPVRDALVGHAALGCGLGDLIGDGYCTDSGVRHLAFLALSDEVARCAIECMRGKLPWAEFSIALEG